MLSSCALDTLFGGFYADRVHSGKRKATVWCLSVRPSVSRNVVFVVIDSDVEDYCMEQAGRLDFARFSVTVARYTF